VRRGCTRWRGTRSSTARGASRSRLRIDELPEHERAVIELAYWSELSQSEIAERLHIPLGTVKTRTRTGLARLATLLEEDLR
jgi:RNA polymerase sigma-70 factor (ECF subfamily)